VGEICASSVLPLHHSDFFEDVKVIGACISWLAWSRT
jgi:hypothetical protein